MGLPPPLGRVAKPDACPASSAGTSEDKFSALDARTAPSHLPRPRSTRTLTALIRIQARYLSPMTTLRPASTRPPVLVISRFSVCANPARPTSRRSASAVPERGELGGVLCRFAFSASAAAAEPPRPCRNLGRNKWGGRFRRFFCPRGGGSGRLPALVPADLKGGRRTMRRSLPVLSRPLWRSASNRPRPPGKVLSTRSTKSRVGGTDFGGVGGVCNLFQNTRRSAFNQAGCRQGREGGGGGGGGRALAAGRCRRPPPSLLAARSAAPGCFGTGSGTCLLRSSRRVYRATCAIGESAQGHAPRATRPGPTVSKLFGVLS